MKNKGELQKKLLEDFLILHFKSRRVRYKKKWKVIVTGYDNKTYYVANEMQKSKLREHLFELTNEIFSFDSFLTKKVISRFI